MYPKNLSKFRAWTKAMEANATVGTPDYGKQASKGISTQNSSKSFMKRRKRRRRKRKKAKNA